MENQFDLIEVRFGNELTQARPYQFDQDENGNLIKPIKASTICPHCGHGNEVDLSNWGYEIISLKCTNCGAGEEDFVEPPKTLDANSTTVNIERDIEKEIIEALSDGPEKPKREMIDPVNKGSIEIDNSAEIETLKSSCPFVDPIELGKYVLDEL